MTCRCETRELQTSTMVLQVSPEDQPSGTIKVFWIPLEEDRSMMALFLVDEDAAPT